MTHVIEHIAGVNPCPWCEMFGLADIGDVRRVPVYDQSCRRTPALKKVCLQVISTPGRPVTADAAGQSRSRAPSNAV